MQKLLIIALLAASTSAWAQSVQLEVKGVTLGASRPHLMEALNASAHCVQAEEQAGLYEELCGNSDSTGGLPDTFAGQPASITYYLRNGRVGEVTVAHLAADNYQAVLDALTAKYGAPKITHPSVQTRGGATFENTVATWTRGDDEIVFDRYGRTMEVSWLRFTSGEFGQARERWQAARATEAASDM